MATLELPYMKDASPGADLWRALLVWARHFWMMQWNAVQTSDYPKTWYIWSTTDLTYMKHQNLPTSVPISYPLSKVPSLLFFKSFFTTQTKAPQTIANSRGPKTVTAYNFCCPMHSDNTKHSLLRHANKTTSTNMALEVIQIHIKYFKYRSGNSYLT